MLSSVDDLSYIIIFSLLQKSVINVRSRAIYNSMEKSFTSENLKTVEVKCQDIDQRVHKLMKSLNSYGIPLERINIQQTNQFSECKFSIDNLYSYTFLLHLWKINQRNSLTVEKYFYKSCAHSCSVWNEKWESPQSSQLVRKFVHFIIP